jgi:metal-responsive CopG/Arc/MetJ family transcriptional regulator
MSAEKRSVSAPEELFKAADARVEELGYTNFSQYIQALIHADLNGKVDHSRGRTQYLIHPTAHIANEVEAQAKPQDNVREAIQQIGKAARRSRTAQKK